MIPRRSGNTGALTLFEGVDGEEAGGLEGVPGDSTPFTMTAVGDGAMAIGSVSVGGRNSGMVLAPDVVETIVDTSAGDAPQLHEINSNAGRLREVIDDPTLAARFQLTPSVLQGLQRADTGGLGQLLPGLRAGGFGVTIDGGTSTATLVGLYQSSTAAEATEAVATIEEIRERIANPDAVESIDASYDGRATVVTLDSVTQSLLAGDFLPGSIGGFDAG